MSRLRSLIAACLLLALAACAHRPPEAPPANAPSWSGRLSLQVRSDPPQAFSAAFDLKGTASAGELVLTTPLGSTLAMLSWNADGAWVRSGGQTRRYASTETLFEQATGAPVPLAALFDWLAGKPTAVAGWQADLAQASDGRLSARRTSPLPEAELRLVLDK